MARTIAIWGPTGLATPTTKLMLRTALTTVVETITLTEHATVKRLYTGTVTASAGQYRHNLLTEGSFIGGGSVTIGATDAVTYEEDNSLDWGGIVGQTATVGLTNTTVGVVTAVTGLTAATVHSDLDDIQTRLPAALVSGRIDASVGAIGGDVQSQVDLKDFADAGYDPATNKIQGVVLADTVTTLTNLPAITANWLTAAGLATDAVTEIQSGLATAAALTIVDDFLDTEIAAIQAKTDLIPASPAAVGSAMTLTSGERDAIAAALLDLAAGIETGVTPRQAIRAIAAICAGIVSGAGTGTEVFKAVGAAAGGTTRATVTVDASGNRSAVSLP